MRRRASVVQAVLRAYLTSIVAFAATTVIVGGVATLVVVVGRDDANAIALARTLGTELSNHEADPRPAKDALVIHELVEQQWFGRRIEVWRGNDRIGGAPKDGLLGRWEGDEGCRQVKLRGEWRRVCAVQTAPMTTIVVASSFAAILVDVIPLVGVLAVTALAASLAFAALGRRWIGRRLSPLADFERRVGSLPALDRSERIESDWGVAEVDTLASTLNALLERIHRAVEREQRFVADAAHELRTPLTRLRAQLELASEELRDGTLPHARIAAAARTSQDLGRTMEVLLALARNQATTDEAVDLDDVVAACVASLPPEHAARVQSQYGDGAIVRGDELLLRLAVGNLIDNALKYTAGRIQIGTNATQDAATVQVDDEGPGLADADLSRLRAPFVRGHDCSTRVLGAGLGLALVEHVATLHGGSLDLGNTAGGLRATLQFPPWRSDAVRTTAASSASVSNDKSVPSLQTQLPFVANELDIILPP